MREVGCAGLLVEDTFCGPVTALPPEGALAVLDSMPVQAGGCAANVAIDLAKQGISVDVVGCVGQDAAANVITRIFKVQGVGTSRVICVSGYETSKTVILLVEGQDRRYLHYAGANCAFSIDHISRDWVSQLKVFYLGGLFALPGIDFVQLAALLKYCKECEVTTVVDVVTPQSLHGMSQLESLLPFIDVFVPNDDEAKAFTGLADPHEQLKIFRDTGANTVIITCGEQGSVASRGGKMWSCGTYYMKGVDPSGSGDAFTSGVIRSTLMGWDLPQTLRYASAVGASATRTVGTTQSVFSAAEAEAFIAANRIAVTDER